MRRRISRLSSTGLPRNGISLAGETVQGTKCSLPKCENLSLGLQMPCENQVGEMAACNASTQETEIRAPRDKPATVEFPVQ